MDSYIRTLKTVPFKFLFKNLSLIVSCHQTLSKKTKKRSRSKASSKITHFESHDSTAIIRFQANKTIAKDVEEEDLEKLCEDLEAYEKEFSNIIKDGKDEFGKHLNLRID